jgi:two-component system chemotaxis sensor kinase CheA
MTVSTTPCLLVGVAGQSFALPVTNVSRIVKVATAEIEHLEGAAVVRDDQSIVGLADLADVLGIERDPEQPPAASSPAIMLGSADRRMAFLVDVLIDLQNVVTKGLPAPLHRVRHLSGATILGSGEVINILNAANLIRTASPHRDAEPADAFVAPRPPVVLLVEDSITTRALERNILESAGYEVRAVGDGMEAWSMLQEGGIDVVVTDVYMPGMDGFELTAKLRGEDRLGRIPVVIVTSKDSRSQRERGIEVGADAYIVKGSFEQRNLVDAVARLV